MVAMKRQSADEESLDFGNCLMLLPHSHKANKPQQKSDFGSLEFECKTCNRKFSSFQALGGHRASHKRQKIEGGSELKAHANLSLCLWNNNNNNNKTKMHECPICGMEFSLGQALGGHMRKHRGAANDVNEKGFSSVNINRVVAKVPVLNRSNSKRIMCLDLDLNLNLTPNQNDLLPAKKAPHVLLSLF